MVVPLLGGSPFNECTENDRLFLGFFPHLFFLGRKLATTGSMSLAFRQKLLRQHDCRFAPNSPLLLLFKPAPVPYCFSECRSKNAVQPAGDSPIARPSAIRLSTRAGQYDHDHWRNHPVQCNREKVVSSQSCRLRRDLPAHHGVGAEVAHRPSAASPNEVACCALACVTPARGAERRGTGW